MRLLVAGLSFVAIFAQAAQTVPVKVAAVPGYSVRNQFALGGAGGWDYLSIDAKSNRLFIARSDRVMVVDTDSGKLLATIAGTQGVHGIALAPELGMGFTSNGRTDTVSAFDLASLKITATIDVHGHNPDAILYDRASKHLYTFNGRSKDISVIDPQQGKVLETIALDGKPEFAVSENTGHIYVNIEDKAELVDIDSLHNKIIAAWPLKNCEEPTGLALDVARQRLFSVCGNGVMLVTDSSNGARVAQIPIGKGPDAAAFDATRGLVFSSNGEDGTLTVIHQDSADRYSVLGNIKTRNSARTMALNESNHRVYLVAAEFGPVPAPSAEQPHPRAPVLDGSFGVVVVGN